jgi:predicted HNH restriction endonuclease
MTCKNKYHSIRTTGKGNHHFGGKNSIETRKKISEKNKGRVESEEKRRAQSEFMKAHNPMCSMESRKRISIKNTGRIISESARKKSSITHTLHLGTDKYEKFCKENNRRYSFMHQRLKRKLEESTICQICNKPLLTKNGNAGMNMHHIDKNKRNNDDDNLVSLCAACHYAVHRGMLVNSEGKLCREYVTWLGKYKNKIIKLNIILYGEGK